jgi:thiol:disulfide interchange protein
MKRSLATLATVVALAACGAEPAAETSSLYLNADYDPAADPFADLERAKALALAEHRRILVEVGGDWCVWCHILDAYLENNTDVRRVFEGSFVVLRVNWDRDGPVKNEEFLAQYPERSGYPHFFVLEADGTFIHSQDTVLLEDGAESYDKDAMLAFARAWDLPDG